MHQNKHDEYNFLIYVPPCTHLLKDFFSDYSYGTDLVNYWEISTADTWLHFKDIKTEMTRYFTKFHSNILSH